jgi:hypothetical protein
MVKVVPMPKDHTFLILAPDEGYQLHAPVTVLLGKELLVQNS